MSVWYSADSLFHVEMERDDKGNSQEAVFIVLFVCNSLVLVFALIRIYQQIRSVKPFRPLLLFYSILVLLLLARLLYFLDVFCHFNDVIYFGLQLLPIALIFCAGSLVSYIWSCTYRRDISLQFLHRFEDAPSKSRFFRFTCFLNVLFLSSFFVSFTVCYSLDQKNTFLY